MFDVGFAEIFLLGLIGLLVLGPERLPGAARTIGGFVRKARASWTQLRRTIETEMAEADISEPIKKAREEFTQIGKNLTDVPGFASETRKPKPKTTNRKAKDDDSVSPASKTTAKDPDTGKPE